jgi:hypothetical protein
MPKSQRSDSRRRPAADRKADSCFENAPRGQNCGAAAKKSSKTFANHASRAPKTSCVAMGNLAMSRAEK